MIFFARKITVFIASFIALIILILSLIKNFSGIETFHGSIIDFAIYFFDKFSSSLFQSLKTFFISAFMIYPILYILEIRVHNQYIEKQKRLAEEKRKQEEEESEVADQESTI